MTQTRILLLGGSGQVGQCLRRSLIPSDWELLTPSHSQCDISNTASLRYTLQSTKPALVINTAAMTAVDACEKEKDKAHAINFDGPAHLAAQCSSLEALLLHVSTDYVFDGKESDRPYLPDDAMNPINEYGASKMMGEEAIRHELPWHVILRVSSVFSAVGTNLLTKALSNIEERDELKIASDQIMCPTYAPCVAKALITIATALLKGKADGFGTFHLCGEPAVTRFEFIRSIMDVYAPHTKKRPTILPARSSDFPGFAERPPYSVLDCAKIMSVYGIKQEPWQDGLKEAIPILAHARGQAA